jgi:hypothetical protein
MNKFREDRKDDRTKIKRDNKVSNNRPTFQRQEPLDFENDFNFEEMMG